LTEADAEEAGGLGLGGLLYGLNSLLAQIF
jgi:hypothetical protein